MFADPALSSELSSALRAFLARLVHAPNVKALESEFGFEHLRPDPDPESPGQILKAETFSKAEFFLNTLDSFKESQAALCQLTAAADVAIPAQLLLNPSSDVIKPFRDKLVKEINDRGSKKYEIEVELVSIQGSPFTMQFLIKCEKWQDLIGDPEDAKEDAKKLQTKTKEYHSLQQQITSPTPDAQGALPDVNEMHQRLGLLRTEIREMQTKKKGVLDRLQGLVLDGMEIELGAPVSKRGIKIPANGFQVLYRPLEPGLGSGEYLYTLKKKKKIFLFEGCVPSCHPVLLASWPLVPGKCLLICRITA